MKKKIIIGTIASVFILCSVSTAVPAFTGSSARELINYANETPTQSGNLILNNNVLYT